MNPSVVVEVLSPSTEDFDRGEKFERYKLIPSVREYVLVSQDERRIDVFSRDADWACVTAHEGETAVLSSIGVTLGVDDLYFDPLARDSSAKWSVRLAAARPPRCALSEASLREVAGVRRARAAAIEPRRGHAAGHEPSGAQAA